MTSRPIDRLTVHHTASPAVVGDRRVDASLLAERHRRRGLGVGAGDERDCAYHFVVLPGGTVEPGRPVRTWGSATTCGEDSLRSIAVALVGDFSLAHARGRPGPMRPTPEQLIALEGLALWAFGRCGFGPASVRGHREVVASECPGELLDLDALRARLERARRAGASGARPPAAVSSLHRKEPS